MDKNLKIEVAEGVQEVIIREGDAPIIHEPERLQLTGSIAAPGDFMDKRKSEIDTLKTHVRVDIENTNIILVVNETSYIATSITGRMQPFPDLENFKINGRKVYSPRELYEVIKFMGSYFKDRETYTNLCKKLTQFTSRIESDFKDANDYKGNVAYQKLTKIQTDLDLKFHLSIPIFKNCEPSIFEVEICLDSKDMGVICWLESVELHELKKSIAADAMNKQIERLSEYVTIFV